MDSGATDGHLVREVIAGRRQAFDELIRRHQRQAFSVSYRLLGRSEDALEVTQNSFLKAFTSIGTLQQPEGASLRGWLRYADCLESVAELSSRQKEQSAVAAG